MYLSGIFFSDTSNNTNFPELFCIQPPKQMVETSRRSFHYYFSLPNRLQSLHPNRMELPGQKKKKKVRLGAVRCSGGLCLEVGSCCDSLVISL